MKELRGRWGPFHDFTGHESIKTCFWCGKATRNRYCSESCKDLYHRHFSWPYASDCCIQRAIVSSSAWSVYDGTYRLEMVKCGDCGIVGRYDQISSERIRRRLFEEGITYYGGYQVHHVFPMNGDDRNWSWLNRPENLILLCKRCHKLRHRQWEYLIRRSRMVSEIRTLGASLSLAAADTQTRV